MYDLNNSDNIDDISEIYADVRLRKKVSGVQNNLLQYLLERAGFPALFLLKETFLGYKFRKSRKKLEIDDDELPTLLLRLYYSLNEGEIEFDKMRQSFINKYVKNESELEGVNNEDIHGHEEVLGLADMYEYLQTDEMEKYFSVYSLKDLHSKLFSHTPHPECAGRFRNHDAYLPGTGIGLYEWSRINEEIYRISPRIDYLHEKSHVIKDVAKIDELLEFLDECLEVKVELIRIHPFGDGNGRTIRAFFNKLILDAGLPPIYIKSNERTEYHTAMNKALLEGDYSLLKSFYRYKLCDSIVELDINDRVKEEGIQKSKKDDLK